MPMTVKKMSARADDAAGLLSAMSNARRLQILCRLLEGEMTVGSLAEEMNISQSALSQHLAKLRNRRLVRTRRDAQTIYYAVDSDAVSRILDALDDIYYGHG